MLDVNFYETIVFKFYFPSIDTPPNSLKYSNVNLKVKTTEEGVGGMLLSSQQLRVRWACWSSNMRIRTSDKQANYSYGLTQTKQ